MWMFPSTKVVLIEIGGSLAAPPLSHHRAYGSVPRRFDYSTVFILADSKNVEQLTDRGRERVRRARQLFSEATVKTVHVAWTANSSYAESAIPPDR